jgi:hypothetical protein
MWWFPDNFFCLVCNLEKKYLNNLIHGGSGSTWGYNFYMGTQNGLKLEISWQGILIHPLELKLRRLQAIPMFV